MAALKGYRFLGDYRSDDEQYQALMSAGATFAQAHQLRPGIALSPAQVAQLTSDIVWLETQSVRLPDGSTTTALVPRVYLTPKAGDLAQNGQLFGGPNGGGSVISAAQVRLALSGDMNNSATIQGRRVLDISAQNISNSGLIQSDQTLLSARQNIDITGGQVQARSGMQVKAGGDLNITTTTQGGGNTVGANTFSQQGIDRVAGLYVSAPAGVLLASAGGSINLSAAQLSNAGSGTTSLSAGDSVNLGTVQVGSSVSGAGAVRINAQNDINLRAAQVNASGALSVNAGGNVNIEAGQSAESLAEARQVKSSGFLSSTTTTTRSSSASTTAQASELGGQSVTIASGADTRTSGSNVIADQGLNMRAGGNLTIQAAQNTQSASSFNETKKSGLFSSGGLSITVGKQQQSTDQQSQQTTGNEGQIPINRPSYRFLTGYGSDEQQYRALMTAGATFAQSQQLRPGIALSPEQVALLTSDIVWLVEREVTLADGSKTQALVPQVYAVPRPGDLNGSGALMAASEVNINFSGDLANAGSIAGRRVTQINAQNIRNIGGSIQGAITALSARQDISNTGGSLQA